MRSRVGEHDDLAPGFGYGSALGGGVAVSLFLAVKSNTAGSKTARDLIGAIGRAVGRYDDLEMRRGVIERECVFKLGGEVAFLVISRDDDGNRRDPMAAFYRFRPDPAKQKEQEGIANVGRSEEHTSELQSLAYLVCR